MFFFFSTSHRLDDASGDGVVSIIDVSKQSCGALLNVRRKRFKGVLCICPNTATCSSLQVEVICRKFSSLKKQIKIKIKQLLYTTHTYIHFFLIYIIIINVIFLTIEGILKGIISVIFTIGISSSSSSSSSSRSRRRRRRGVHMG